MDNWNRDEIDSSDFIYESSKQSALDHFLKLLISYNFSRAVHESLASEEGFRMAAMDSASSNAKEMIQELTLYYNRSRQAAITTELTEIVAEPHPFRRRYKQNVDQNNITRKDHTDHWSCC